MANRKRTARPLSRTKFTIVMADGPLNVTRLFVDGVEVEGVVSIDREDEKLVVTLYADQIEVMGGVRMPEMFIAENKPRRK